MEEALKFAQEQLSVDGDYLQLPELERTLALLAFDKPHESPYGDLLDYTQRQQLASQVNEAILEEQGGDSSETGHPPLVSLIKLLLWTQDELDKSKMKYAKLKDISDPSIAPPEWPLRVIMCIASFITFQIILSLFLSLEVALIDINNHI